MRNIINFSVKNKINHFFLLHFNSVGSFSFESLICLKNLGSSRETDGKKKKWIDKKKKKITILLTQKLVFKFNKSYLF